MGPSGPATLALLVVAFVVAGLAVVRLRAWPVRVMCGGVAFVAAAAFGVSAVNAYYDYYQSWGALLSDLAADNGPPANVAILPMPPVSPVPRAGSSTSTAPPRLGSWRVERLRFPGPVSGVQGRTALAVLPPQPTGRLPVLVLLHGEPGGPDSWTHGLQLADVLRREQAAGHVHPMLVVLPDLEGFHDQQCLDAVQGPRLSTYLQRDVPADIERLLPASLPGASWVVGGLSEGGFCAADLVLHQPSLFSGAGVLDGYFRPAVSAEVSRRVYGGHRERAAQDDPTALLERWAPQRPLPRFWLMAGTGNARDYARAVTFGQLVARREPLRFLSVVRGRHTTPAWRAALPDLLRWASAVVRGEQYDGSTSVRLN